MKVKREELVTLFKELGVDAAESWDNHKMGDKAAHISKFMEPDFKFTTPEAQATYTALLDAEHKKEKVEVDGEDKKKDKDKDKKKVKPANKDADAAPPPKPAPAKPKAEPPAKKQPRAAGESKWTGYAQYKDKPLAFSEGRGDGVLKFIVDTLKQAGVNNKPLSKKDIHEKMVRKFPNRDKDQMVTTLNNQVPSRLRIVRGIHVWKTKAESGKDVRYWIQGTGTKPQPEEKKVEKTAPAKAAAPAKPAVAKKPVPKKAK